MVDAALADQKPRLVTIDLRERLDLRRQLDGLYRRRTRDRTSTERFQPCIEGAGEVDVIRIAITK